MKHFKGHDVKKCSHRIGKMYDWECFQKLCIFRSNRRISSLINVSMSGEVKWLQTCDICCRSHVYSYGWDVAQNPTCACWFTIYVDIDTVYNVYIYTIPITNNHNFVGDYDYRCLNMLRWTWFGILKVQVWKQVQVVHYMQNSSSSSRRYKPRKLKWEVKLDTLKMICQILQIQRKTMGIGILQEDRHITP